MDTVIYGHIKFANQNQTLGFWKQILSFYYNNKFIHTHIISVTEYFYDHFFSFFQEALAKYQSHTIRAKVNRSPSIVLKFLVLQVVKPWIINTIR